MISQTPLKNEADLLDRCRVIEGITLAQLAAMLQLVIPEDPVRRKGWVGQALELALGTTAQTRPLPDFDTLGIELKSLPMNHSGKPAESTFVTTISLCTVHQETWLTSQCYAKLKRVLWVPFEASKQIAFPERRIGQPVLWSPTEEETAQLSEDWTELSWMIGMGRLAEIHAGMGRYLQVRPKASNAQSLCYGYDETGQKILTLPRGFYLRSRFTEQILTVWDGRFG